MVHVGYARVGFVLGMYISCCLGQFHLRWVPNVKPFFGGICAIDFCQSSPLRLFNLGIFYDIPVCNVRYSKNKMEYT